MRCYYSSSQGPRANQQVTIRGQCRGRPLDVEIHDCEILSVASSVPISPSSSPRPSKPETIGDPTASGATAATAGTILGLSLLSFVLLLIVSPLIFLVTEVLILAWVVKDARARGSDGAVWLIVIWMSWLLGLLVYLASRPPGMLTPCEHCGNRRLDYLKRCPYCLRDV